MKLFFRIIFRIFFILTILVGCATTEDIKETDPVALLNQGVSYGKEGQYDRSIAYFNKAIEIDPRYLAAYNNRGNAYRSKGQYDKAISEYSKAIEINPKYADAYFNRGYAYYQQGQYQRAIENFDQVLRLNPDHAAAEQYRENASSFVQY
jgi:tetratricopeptide (TPR) repeat protein